MDFRPTLGKVLVTVLIPLIANFIGVQFLGGCEGFLNCYADSLIGGWFIWLPLLIVIYIIFSLNLILKKK